METNRIMIIGCCGAGKSTLSMQVAEQTGLPLIHLDQHFWKPNWVESDKQQWKTKVEELAAQHQWIIDGNYGGTMDIRLEKADLVIFLDRSRWICIYRVLKRIFQHYGKRRPDMPDGCPERIDFSFLFYTFTFWNRKRPGILKRLENLRDDQSVIILKNDKEIQNWLEKGQNAS